MLGQRPDEFELSPQVVLVAVENRQLVEIAGPLDHAVAQRVARVAAVIHDLHEVEVIGLDVANVRLDGRWPDSALGAEVMPKRHGRPVRSPTLKDRDNTFCLVHGFTFPTYSSRGL